MDMLKSPGHEHLGDEGRQADGQGPEPLDTVRHEEIFLHHEEKAGNEAPELEIKDNFRIRFESPLSQHADGHVSPGAGKSAQCSIQGIDIKGCKVPHLHDHHSSQGDEGKRRNDLPGHFFFQEYRRQNAHEKSGKLSQNLSVSQRQSFNGEEVQVESDGAEHPAKRQKSHVSPGKDFLTVLPCNEGNEEKTEKSPEKSEFSRGHGFQHPGTAAHSGEKNGAEKSRNNSCGQCALSSPVHFHTFFHMFLL